MLANNQGRSLFLLPTAPAKATLLQPQEVILGMFGEYVERRERVWSGGIVSLLGDLGFSTGAARVALNRVVARGLLKPVRRGKYVYYSITPRLAAVHHEGRRQTFALTHDIKWDGDWTLVWYSIPEAQRVQRGRLSRWLNFQGFGSLQDGTWLASGNREGDVAKLARNLNLEKSIIILVGRLGDSIPIESVIARVWNVDQLSKMYNVFIREFSPYGTATALKKLNPAEAFSVRTRAIELFRKTTAQDPKLPDSAMDVEWRRSNAIKLFDAVQRDLYPIAYAHFRDSAGPGSELKDA